MNGVELARIVHQRWPAIRLLLTSGHHHLREAGLPADGKFVSKPWTHDMLVEEIRKAMG